MMRTFGAEPDDALPECSSYRASGAPLHLYIGGRAASDDVRHGYGDFWSCPFNYMHMVVSVFVWIHLCPNARSPSGREGSSEPPASWNAVAGQEPFVGGFLSPERIRTSLPAARAVACRLCALQTQCPRSAPSSQQHQHSPLGCSTGDYSSSIIA